MGLTVHATLEVEVIIRERLPASKASETSRMVLAHDESSLILRLGLQILALDPSSTAEAQRAVLLVVVLLAVGLVVQDVKVRVGERLLARFADEALFVPAACQASIGCFNGFAFDQVPAAATVRFAADGWPPAQLHLRWAVRGIVWHWRRRWMERWCRF